MPSASSTLSFALVVAVVTVTPGLDTALVLRAALGRGRRHAASNAAGIGTGILVWAVAAAGVSAVLTASESTYGALRFAGAAYLAALGIRLMLGARRGGRAEVGLDDSAAPTAWRADRAGLVTNLLNPKVGALSVALLPRFVPTDGSPPFAGTLLGAAHVLEGACWFALVIAGAGAARRWLASDAARRWIDAVTGTALVGLGAGPARSHAP